MAALKLTALTAYMVHGKGLVVITLQNDVKLNSVVEFNGEKYRVREIHCEPGRLDKAVTLFPLSEAEKRIDDNKDVKSIFENMFSNPVEEQQEQQPEPLAEDPVALALGFPPENPVQTPDHEVFPFYTQPTDPTVSKNEQRKANQSRQSKYEELMAKMRETQEAHQTLQKISTALEPMQNHMERLRNWTISQVTGIDPDGVSVLVLALVLPTKAMNHFIDNHIPVMEETIKTLPLKTGTKWACIKGIGVVSE